MNTYEEQCFWCKKPEHLRVVMTNWFMVKQGSNRHHYFCSDGCIMEWVLAKKPEVVV